MCGRGLVVCSNVAITSKVYIASGSGSVSIGARWGNYSGGVPTQGYNAEMLSTGEVILWRISDWTQLGSYQIAGYSNGTWYTLTLRADGTALSVQVNGVTRITATDSTFTTGEAGLWSYASTAVSQHRFDDFVIQVLGGGGAPGGRLYAPEQGTGLFERLSNLIREVVNRIRNTPISAPMTSRLSAPPAGQVWKVYYYAGSQLIALRVLTQTGNTLYYLHTDHLGSTSLTTDSSGNVVARQNYYPYGQIRPGGTGTMPTDVGFTGQRADATGLMFYNARYYSPYLNRWIQPDTIVPDPANPQSLNRYSYVYNNPVKRTDSTGRCADDDAVCKAYEQWILDWSGIILKDSAYRIWSADEARLIYETLYDIALKFNQIIPYKDVADLMKAAWEGVTLERMDYTLTGGAWLPPGYLGKRIQFPDWNSANGLWHDEAWTKHVIAEELGHSWDIQGTSLGGLNGGHISQAMIPYVGGSTRDCAILILLCWHYDPGPEDPVDDHAGSNPVEDWGGAFAQFVEPLPPGIRQPGILTPRREQFVRMQIALLVTEIGK